MRIFISEYVCSGAWQETDLPPSLAAEGRAMFSAIVEDFSRLPATMIVTTWDLRCGASPFAAFKNVETHFSNSSLREGQLFETLPLDCDYALVIAPEFDGILEQRCHKLHDTGVVLLNSSIQGIQTCSDKFALAKYCESHGINTIPTVLLGDLSTLDNQVRSETPIIVKPRYGAGSCDIQEFICLQSAIESTTHLNPDLFIAQPKIEGLAKSVAGFYYEKGIIPLSVVDQHLSTCGHFKYLGGRVSRAEEKQDGVELLSQVSPLNLRGYNGIDYIIPDDSKQPVLVEVNPRLTTSYIGYRHAYKSVNLAEYFLGNPSNQLVQSQPVTFCVAGQSVTCTHDSKSH